MSRALRDWSLYCCIIFSSISLAFIIHEHPKLAKIALIVMCCAPIIFIVDFLYQIFFYFAVPIEPRPSVLLTWQAQFSNDRIFGDTALPITFMLAALINTTQNKRAKRFFLGLCFAVSIMLMFSGGRGILISCTLSIVLGLLLNKYARKQLIYFSLSLLLSFLVALLLVNLLSGDLSQGTILRGDSSGRIFILQQALNQFVHSPILGIGPAQFTFTFNQVILSHPHNLFIQIITEWGVFSFSAFITILFIVFFQLIQYVKNETNLFNVFIFLGSVSFLVNCNFNGAHVYPSSQIYGLFIISWLMSIYFFSSKKSTTYQKDIFLQITRIAPLIISMTLVITTYIALGCAGNYAPQEAGYGGPRFWLADSPHDDIICNQAPQFMFTPNFSP